MRKSIKIATIAAVLLLALGAAALVYAGSQSRLEANSDDHNQMGMWNMRTFFWPNNASLRSNFTLRCHSRRIPQVQASSLGRIKTFLENATLSTVQGTVVSESKGMLILNTDSGQVRVLLPRDWSINSEVVDRATLFNGALASSGQNVTVKVLESDVFSNTNFSINVMIGYEASNSTGTHAYAVLPFNIQPHS